MRPATLALGALALVGLVLAARGREPRPVATHGAWQAVDRPSSLREMDPGLLAIRTYSTSLHPVRRRHDLPPVPRRLELTIEARPGGVRLSTVARSPDGTPPVVRLSLDGGPARPVALRGDPFFLAGDRDVARALSGHTEAVFLVPGDAGPQAIRFSLDGLDASLAALDAEARAREEGVAPLWKATVAGLTWLGETVEASTR